MTKKGTQKNSMASRKKIIIGIVAAVAVITLAGSIGILMNRDTSSPAVDAAAPNPNTLESLDITEYGLSLNYDARYGDLAYAITDNDGTTAKIVTVTNANFTAPDKCSNKDTYKTLARFVVSDTKDNTVGSYVENGDIYAKVGAKYVGILPYRLNLPVDDACYDKATATEYYAQQQSLYDSFDAVKTNNPAS